MDYLKAGCLQFERDCFQEKKLNQILTTGSDLSLKLKQALIAHDPDMKVTSYKEIGGYIVSLEAEGYSPILIIDEYDKLMSNDLTKYTYVKIKHLIHSSNLRVVPIKEIVKVLKSDSPAEIHEWFTTYET